MGFYLAPHALVWISLVLLVWFSMDCFHPPNPENPRIARHVELNWSSYCCIWLGTTAALPTILLFVLDQTPDFRCGGSTQSKILITLLGHLPATLGIRLRESATAISRSCPRAIHGCISPRCHSLCLQDYSCPIVFLPAGWHTCMALTYPKLLSGIRSQTFPRWF